MYGIIDLGSNTVRLNIYQVKNQQLVLYSTRKETTSLASYVDMYRNLTDEGIQRAIEVVRLFSNMAKQARVKKLFTIATASLRNVKNGKIAKETIEKETGIKIDLLSGEQEAMADFYGVKLANDFEDGFVIDIGGASTEIVEYTQGEVKHAFALPIGSLNAYMRYVDRILPTEEELDQVKKEVLSHLRALNIEFGLHSNLYGVGGTLRAAQKLHFYFNKGDENLAMMTRHHVKAIMKQILTKDKDAITDVIRIIPERVHTILPGLMILKTITKELQVDNIIVENFGVREGYLYQKIFLSEKDDVIEHELPTS